MRRPISTAAVLIAVHLALTACGPVPYETRPHPVEVETTTESAGQHLDAARIWAIEDDPFLEDVLADVQAIKKNSMVIPAKEFMDTVFPGQHSAAIKDLSAEHTIDRIRDLSVTHIILIEHRATGGNIHGKVTAVASLITVDQLKKVETLRFDAEGHRAGLSLPLPYIFLIFPYSDPDVVGSATSKIAEVLADKIQEAPNRPLRLTILASDNLIDIIARVNPPPAEEHSSPRSTDPVKRWKNPAGFYSDMMSGAREEGEWVYYNPLAHIQMLLTSVIMAPTMVVVDVLVGEDGRTTTATRAEARAKAPEPTMTASQQFRYATEAIDRSDWEAGYRLLEDFVASEDEMLRMRTLQLLEDHPELLVAAQESFSEAALEESKSMYGAQASTIEQSRLELYRIIAEPDAYSRAQQGFLNVFERMQK